MDDSQKYIPPLILALFVSIVPHVANMPMWVSAWCLFIWASTLVSLRYNRPRPGRFARNALAVIGIAGLLLTYQTIIDSSAYISLLAIMAAIKPFEVSSHRDRMITVFLAYFIVITSLFQSETLLITIYMFISVLVTTAVLVRINDPEGRFKEHFRVSTILLFQAVPVMLALFLLFPRIEGNLIGIPFSNTGVTGFSGSLTPGGVSRLVEDNSVAFRVEFNDDIPASQDLYWRGVVFDHFDGSAWHRKKQGFKNPQTIQAGNRVDYTVILEPHRNRWLFALDFPVNIPDAGILQDDFTVLSNEPVYRTKRYHMQSRPLSYTGRMNFPGAAYTQTSQTGNPESRKLARILSANHASAEEMINRTLRYLEDNEFVYTLNPPTVGKNFVDDFLFNSKSGFCEHYASAFAFLMRSVGIPARVVGGYLGGEINPYGNYLIVRQSDAHAWVEVWDSEKGWIRVDPTIVVAPERVFGGSANRQRYLPTISSLIAQARFGWDAISKNWDAWFAGYSYDQQAAFLDRLGIDYSYKTGPMKLLLAGLAMVFLFLGIYVLIHMKRKRQKQDNVGKLYEKFLKNLALAGMIKASYAGPLEHAREAARKWPAFEDEIYEITSLYVELRYSRKPGSDTYSRLEKAVKNFRLSKRII